MKNQLIWYGYVNSDSKSKKFELNNMSYYSKSDGIGFP